MATGFFITPGKLMIRKKIDRVFLGYCISIAVMASIYFGFSNIGVTSKGFWLLLKDYFPGISVKIPADFNSDILLPIVLFCYVLLLIYWVLIYLYCRD